MGSENRSKERVGELLLHDAQHAERGKAQGQIRGRRQGENRKGSAGRTRLARQESACREGRVRGEAKGGRGHRESHHDESLSGCWWWWRRNAWGWHAGWRLRRRCTWCWRRWPNSGGGRLSMRFS